ncbi:MAG: Coq4 family protein [Phenylobacterium sp.]
MITDQEKRRFQALTEAGGGGAEALRLAAELKAGAPPRALEALAALWLHAATAAPERLAEIYDGACAGWQGEPVRAPAIPAVEAPDQPIPEAFWQGFWALLAERPEALAAGGVTLRTAELSGLVAAGLQPRLAQAALAYPGCAEAVAQGYPERFTLEALALCPAGSLGGEFHDLIVDNGFDLEVLDRDNLGIDDLPAALAYLNVRILQCHDLWHILAGYRTTGLHEVAISAFQMGQFGHHYSAMFLAMVLTRAAFEQPDAGALLLDMILQAWRHGRESPPLLGLDWPAIWDRPVDQIRADLGLNAYVSPWPADLFEQLSAAA